MSGKSTARRKRLSTKIVIRALEEALGNISAAAAGLRISRQTLYNYMNSNPDVKLALGDIRERMKDNVESVLYSKALAGDNSCIFFYLKTQAKDRGYVERQELAGVTEQPLGISVVEIHHTFKPE